MYVRANRTMVVLRIWAGSDGGGQGFPLRIGFGGLIVAGHLMIEYLRKASETVLPRELVT